MSHMRYWAMSLTVALAGGFLAIDRFAFASNHAVWVGFGVAIAAAVFAVAATGMALVRQDYTFSSLSATSAVVAAWTIIATRVFTPSSALWLAFAGGLALLLLSLRALALHETTVERVVHAVEVNGVGDPASVSRGRTIAVSPASTVDVSPVSKLRDSLQISGAMRSWMYWLTHTGLAVAGGFIVVATFAWWSGGSHHLPGPAVPPRFLPFGAAVARESAQVSARWLVFGIAVAGAIVALSALLDRVRAVRSEGRAAARLAAIVITAACAAVTIALTVLMAGNVTDARWWAFGLGAALVGISLLALIVHELSSERVRHELEIAHAVTTIEPQGADAQ